MLEAESAKLLSELAALMGEPLESSHDGPIDPDFARFRAALAADARAQKAMRHVERLASLGDPELPRELSRRLSAGQFRFEIRPIVRLLAHFDGVEVEQALRLCLRERDPDGSAAALSALRPWLTAADLPMLVAHVRGKDFALRNAAIVAAAAFQDLELATAVADSLEATSADERMQAAITLGWMGAGAFAQRIADRLGAQHGQSFRGFLAALERLGDPGVVPTLIDLLRGADAPRSWGLRHALWRLTGVDPDDGLSGSDEENQRRPWLDAFARGWLNTPPQPEISAVRGEHDLISTFGLAFGRSTICLDFAPPRAGSSWPRWERSLLVRDRALYDIGSTCGTCEAVLRFIGWPTEQVSALARRLEEAPFDPRDPANWLSRWRSVVEHLRSGRYVLGLVSLAVRRIEANSVSNSWFHRRRSIRLGGASAEESPESSDPLSDWVGTPHYQGPMRSVPCPTYPVVLPLQDLGRLDEGRVEHFENAIKSGARPPAVALGWLDERDVGAEWTERFFNLALLNGHHRVEAYARTAVPAPIVVLARVDDSFGPDDERSRFLREALSAFAPP